MDLCCHCMADAISMNVTQANDEQRTGHIDDLPRLPRLAGRGLVLLYRYTLSPLIGPRCRHLPTCSEYAEEAIARFGLWAGSWMALARLLRCHPWGTSASISCRRPARRARWWAPWRYGRWRGTQWGPP